MRSPAFGEAEDARRVVLGVRHPIRGQEPLECLPVMAGRLHPHQDRAAGFPKLGQQLGEPLRVVGEGETPRQDVADGIDYAAHVGRLPYIDAGECFDFHIQSSFLAVRAPNGRRPSQPSYRSR